jgi:hypothetical protein
MFRVPSEAIFSNFQVGQFLFRDFGPPILAGLFAHSNFRTGISQPGWASGFGSSAQRNGCNRATRLTPARRTFHVQLTGSGGLCALVDLALRKLRERFIAFPFLSQRRR